MTSLQLPELGLDLMLIPAGKFLMGSSNSLFGETPARVTIIDQPFYLAKFPVTQRQWVSICGVNPSVFQLSADHPVDSVSWLDAVRFCTLFSTRLRRPVRLPTEAEWEYACRGGTLTEFFFSSQGPFADDSAIPINLRRTLREFAWFDENSQDSTHAVGLKQPNPLGLYDMIGNVWEWCADYWHQDYAGAPLTGETWLEPAPSRPLRCLRGGAWDMNAFRCRSCYRSWDWENVATNRFGFRICVDSVSADLVD